VSDLPPGVSLSDVDGRDECLICDGSGIVEIVECGTGVYKTCERCGGTGKRTKIEKEEEDDR
jgi:DnaJ-class molecular chaperone